MTALIFISITITSLLLFYAAVNKNRSILAASTIWLLLTGLVAHFDYFKDTTVTPPRFLIIPAVALTGSIVILKKVKGLVPDKKYLFAIHMLRLPVELVLYQLYLAKLIPAVMTFEGWNFDILTGITALLILVYYFTRKKYPVNLFLIFWNIAGLLLLLIIVIIAILSAPFPFQQLAFDQPNIAVLQFPFIWLPAYVVPVVAVSHILLLRCLIQNKKCLQ